MKIKPTDYNVALRVFREGERIYNRMSDMYDQIPFHEMDISHDYIFYLPLRAINRVHQYMCVMEKHEYKGDYENSANVFSRFNEIKVIIGYQDKIVLSHIKAATKDGSYVLLSCLVPYEKDTNLWMRKNGPVSEELFEVIKKSVEI